MSAGDVEEVCSDRYRMYGDCVEVDTYLRVMLDGLLDYRRDGKFMVGWHV